MLLLVINSYSQVGIGTTTPSAASMLEVSSQTDGEGAYGGLMPPRVPNVVARNAINATTSDVGLMVFVKDNGSGKACLQIWDGYVWKNGICFVINTPPEVRDLEILGSLYLAQSLEASFTYYDADADPEGEHLYKWYRANNAAGGGQTLISGAISNTYAIVAGDVGKYLAVEVTPVATAGLSPGPPVRSAYRGPITTDPVWPAVQNFETTDPVFPLPLLSVSGGSYISGSNSGGLPTTARYVSPSRGYSVSNGTATLELGPIDVSSGVDATFKLRLAGMSKGSTTNGIDPADTVIISISEDGGTTFSEELLVKGIADNQRWGFTALRVVATSHTGTNTAVEFESGSGNNATTGGISYLEITGIPNSSNLVIKIVMKNNSSGELWVIDDAEIWGN